MRCVFPSTSGLDILRPGEARLGEARVVRDLPPRSCTACCYLSRAHQSVKSLHPPSPARRQHVRARPFLVQSRWMVSRFLARLLARGSPSGTSACSPPRVSARDVAVGWARIALACFHIPNPSGPPVLSLFSSLPVVTACLPLTGRIPRM